MSRLRTLATAGAATLLAVAGASAAYAVTTAVPRTGPIINGCTIMAGNACTSSTTTAADTTAPETTTACDCGTQVCLSPCVATGEGTTSAATTTTTIPVDTATVAATTTAPTTTASAPPPTTTTQAPMPAPTTASTTSAATTTTTEPTATQTVASAAAAPRLSASPGLAVPLRARRLPNGRVRVSASITVDEPASLELQVLASPARAPVPILAGSRLGATVATGTVTRLVDAAPAGVPVAIALVLPAARAQAGRLERIVVVATDDGGRRATIVLRIRAR